jgi:hypothetical protein
MPAPKIDWKQEAKTLGLIALWAVPLFLGTVFVGFCMLITYMTLFK